MAHDLSGEPLHLQRLARPLRVPHDTGAPIALDRFHRGQDGLVHRPVLVVLRTHPDDVAGIALEHDETADQVQQPLGREHAAGQDLDLRNARRCQVDPVDRLPRGVVLPGRRERPRPSLHTIGDDRDLIPREHIWDLAHIRLDLVERPTQCGVRGTRALQLEQCQRQAIHEQQHIRAALALADDRVLIDRSQVVVRRVHPVDQMCPYIPNRAIGRPVLNRNTLCQELVGAPVLRHHYL
ncbi:MAG: hypothetical protein JW395_1301 [Nitrospira sp.]|nr:hypothetical protein [Nitrospira sp.]